MSKLRQVRCIGCGKDRPGTQDRCPHCGAKPYRHKTVDPEEFQEAQRLAVERDRLARRLNPDQ
jgi:predicted amidophosphoribosyltransferase